MFACSDATGPSTDPAGTYDLVTVDGEPLPFDLAPGRIVAADLTLAADGTYSRNWVIYWGSGSPEPATGIGGTYTRAGSALRFRPENGDPVLVGGYDDTGRLQVEDGWLLEYRRR